MHKTFIQCLVIIALIHKAATPSGESKVQISRKTIFSRSKFPNIGSSQIDRNSTGQQRIEKLFCHIILPYRILKTYHKLIIP